MTQESAPSIRKNGLHYSELVYILFRDRQKEPLDGWSVNR